MIHFIDARNFLLQNLIISSLNLKSTDISFVLFKAEWCGHCKRFIPEYEAQSVKHPDVNYLVVDQETSIIMLAQWAHLRKPKFPEINSFPTLAMYNHEGKFIKIVEDRSKLDQEIIDYRSK